MGLGSRVWIERPIDGGVFNPLYQRTKTKDFILNQSIRTWIHFPALPREGWFRLVERCNWLWFGFAWLWFARAFWCTFEWFRSGRLGLVLFASFFSG